MSSEIDTENLEYSCEIKPVDKESVHRICSGQVVLDLGTAIKELVENSVDAGATKIDIKLKGSGADLIEVADNGQGVKEVDFEGLAMKHATSKLVSFNDLLDVQTFGFRGEALSSLSALGNLSILTRHHSSQVGTLLEFDNHGQINSRKSMARPVGTTVSVVDLFSTIPVRRKEFLRRLRYHMKKMHHILKAYCLISSSLRLSCTEINSKGRQSVILNVNSSPSMKENIVQVFGEKESKSLVEVKWDENMTLTEEEIMQSNSSSRLDQNLLSKFKIAGFISSCEHGKGRSTKDCQFFYTNGRPCDPIKLAKLVNEIYHQFNRHQDPFICINIETSRQEIDINITPDKRQILFENEKHLQLILRTVLVRAFEKIPSSFVVTKFEKETSILKNDEGSKNESTTDISKTSHSIISIESLKRNFSSSALKGDRNTDQINSSKRKIESFYQNDLGKKKLCEFSVKTSKSLSPNKEETNETKVSNIQTITLPQTLRIAKDEKSQDEEVIQSYPLTSNMTNTEDIINHKVTPTVNPKIFRADENKSSPKIIYVLDEEHSDIKEKRLSVMLDFEFSKLQTQLKAKESGNDDHKLIHRKFFAQIRPEESTNAEEELRKEFSKQDFLQMRIIGQFNLGFIIGQIRDDLFIVDQHATDEKFNFERMLNSSKSEIQTQRLVIKQNLELPSFSEELLIDHLGVFRDNGFDFEIISEARPTQRVFLSQIPHSKQYTFGKQDIEELIFMLSEDEGCLTSKTILRPSRVRSMFASRACRSSVMIGTALSKNQMRALIDHMAEMDNPWSCPHGRPTMRHLINLKLIY